MASMLLIVVADTLRYRLGIIDLVTIVRRNSVRYRSPWGSLSCSSFTLMIGSESGGCIRMSVLLFTVGLLMVPPLTAKPPGALFITTFGPSFGAGDRSEENTSELQSLRH